MGRTVRARNHLELVARWADDLAHEIKNPFHSMVINLELVKRRAGDPEGLEERAVVVESELHRVHDLIDSLLGLVRPRPSADGTDADTLFDGLLPVFRARTRLRDIEYQHEPGAGAVALPPTDLLLVLLNLVDNAVDAVPQGGRVVTRGARGDGEARIEVVDTGPGFPDLDGDPFDPGVTGRPGRSGLGLAVCREIVAAAGGAIAARPNEDGPGTRVAVTLPTSGAA